MLCLTEKVTRSDKQMQKHGFGKKNIVMITMAIVIHRIQAGEIVQGVVQQTVFLCHHQGFTTVG